MAMAPGPPALKKPLPSLHCSAILMSMQDHIKIANQSIAYHIHKNRRSRGLRLSYDPTKGIVVTIPTYFPYRAGVYFLKRNTAWIEKRITYFAKHPPQKPLKGPRSEYLKYKNQTRKLVTSRLQYFNKFYKFNYRRISIRNSNTRWGSASNNKNLNFHYKLGLIDSKLADYVIVHELAHLGQMNHSPKFWALVARTIPDYKLRRRALKNSGSID